MTQERTKRRQGLWPRLVLEIVPIGPDGREGLPRRLNANSWVGPFVAIFRHHLDHQTQYAVDTTGASERVRSNAEGGERFGMNASNLGVMVGTGTTPPARDDFRLESQILNGNVSGRLAYGVMVFGLQDIAGGYRVKLERTFTNNSGGDITITEVGLYFLHTHDVSLGQPVKDTFMMARDLVSGGHLVADAGGVVVRYFLDWLV